MTDPYHDMLRAARSTPANRAAAYPARPVQAYAVLTLFLAFVVAYIDRLIVGLLIPSMKADLHLSDTQISLFQGLAFALVFAIAGLPIGRLVDKQRRTFIIAAGLTVWSIATVFCGLAQNYTQLLMARGVVGIGEACLAPAAVSLIADYFRPESRGRAMGVVMSGTSAGAAAALILGGFVLQMAMDGHGPAVWFPSDWAPWKVVFVLIGLPGPIVGVMIALMHEPTRKESAAAEASGVSETGFLSQLWRQRRTFGLFYATLGFNAIVAYGVTSWTPTLLMRVYAVPPALTGLVVGLVSTLATVGVACASGFVSDAFARRWRGYGRAVIPAIFLPAQIPVLAALFWVKDPVTATILVTLSMCFATMVSTSAYVALQELVVNEFRGQAVALHVFVYNLLGLGAGPTLIALVVDRVLHDEMQLQASMAFVGVASSIIGTVLAVLLVRAYAAARPRMTTGT